ncbi:hypothetical protein, partial [Pseudomonas aeruginosa]|uniref:hypothetical protein n=1 Tax=Pseudomonas aeruginosa TaxID=287 RepID=UPI001C7CDB06
FCACSLFKFSSRAIGSKTSNAPLSSSCPSSGALNSYFSGAPTSDLLASFFLSAGLPCSPPFSFSALYGFSRTL